MRTAGATTDMRGGGVPPLRWRRLPRLPRSTTNRVLRGVAGGIGERLGVDPLFVRVALVVLSTAGGLGPLLYAALWALSFEPAHPLPPRRPTQRQTLSVTLIVTGTLLLLGQAGLWLQGGLVWSVTLVALGSAFIWSRSDADRRGRWGRFAWLEPLIGGRISLPRVLVGAVLVVVGLTYFATASGAVGDLGAVVVAIAVTLAGAALVLGPYIVRLAQEVGDERAERIRSEERAEVAAHLHDSVLQTLALIQRSEDGREMAALARGQERELRAWLYGRPRVDSDQTLGQALEAAADRIERDHHVAIEVVVVGDGPMDRAGRAAVRAGAEAMLNAARHSGAATVAVYAEVGRDTVQLFVTDEGKGFDPAAVGHDRRGIADSIRGRVERAGGTVTITSDPGEGTEVQLSIPRDRGSAP